MRFRLYAYIQDKGTKRVLNGINRILNTKFKEKQYLDKRMKMMRQVRGDGTGEFHFENMNIFLCFLAGGVHFPAERGRTLCIR